MICTFDDEGLCQQAQMVHGLFVSREFFNASSGAHSLGVPVTTLYIVYFGQQEESLIQVAWL